MNENKELADMIANRLVKDGQNNGQNNNRQALVRDSNGNLIRSRMLGKLAPVCDDRTLNFSRYLRATPTGSLPTAPAEGSWITRIPDTTWGSMLNNDIGDCTVAAAGHMIQQWTTFAAGSDVVIPADPDILYAYERVSGYVPGQPSTDRGASMLQALKYWRKNGIGGHNIQAFAAVNLKRIDHVKLAIYLFGNIYAGLQLPLSAESQPFAWTVTDGGVNAPQGRKGSWGGHCIPIMAYSPQSLSFISWGQRMKMSWNFFADYVDEAYAVVSMDWLDRATHKIAASGFNVDLLMADVSKL